MKQINIFKSVVCVIAFLSTSIFASCQKSDTANVGKESVMANNENNDSIGLPNNDSIINAISHDVDSVKKEIINSQIAIEHLLVSDKSMQRNLRTTLYISLGALTVSILAIIVLVIKLRNKVDENEISLLNKDISYIKNNLNRLEFNFNQSENLKKAHSNSKDESQNSLISSMEKRLSVLENNTKMKEMHNKTFHLSGNLDNINVVQESKFDSKSEKQHPLNINNKVEYAQLNNEAYFMDTLSSKQETCVYKIEYTGSNTGVFDLISLDKIQSSNGWQDVIDIEPTGDCTMEEASDFLTLSLGECKKIDDNTWKVTTNLKIKIFK